MGPVGLLIDEPANGFNVSSNSWVFCNVGSDITDYRKAVKELRLSEQRLRIVTDHLPMRVAYVDEHLQYRFANRAYEQSFGRPRDLLYGMTVREVLGEGAYKQVSPFIQRAMEGETQTFDSEITTMEGYRCYRANYVPQFADDGQHVLGFVSIVAIPTTRSATLPKGLCRPWRLARSS